MQIVHAFGPFSFKFFYDDGVQITKQNRLIVLSQIKIYTQKLYTYTRKKNQCSFKLFYSQMNCCYRFKNIKSSVLFFISLSVFFVAVVVKVRMFLVLFGGIIHAHNTDFYSTTLNIDVNNNRKYFFFRSFFFLYNATKEYVCLSVFV